MNRLADIHAKQASKQQWREDFRFARRILDADLINTTRWKTINNLRALYGQVGPCVTAVYYPRGKEIDIRPWVEELWTQNETVLLPRVVAKGFPLTFNIWTPDDHMDRDALEMPCATGPEMLPNFIIMPCLGYNREGYRLGYGGGYYDMTLKAIDFPITTAGVCYTAHEVQDFPAQYHDQRLDHMVTGKEVITC